MASGRFLSTSIAEDDRLGKLSMAAELLYLKTIPHLDRDGMISGKAGLLWGKICPLREELISEMQRAIDGWIQVGLVIRMMTEQGPVLFFPGFLKNNRLTHYDRERPSRYPAPPGYVRTDNGLVPDGEPSPKEKPKAAQIPPLSNKNVDSVQDNIQDKVPELVPDELLDSVQDFALQEQDQDQDQVEDKGREIARAAQRPSLPPSLAIFQEFFTKPVNSTQSDAITSAITDLGLWRQVLTEWSLRGYNMGNVNGLLDWYRDGIPPPSRNGMNRGRTTGSNQADSGESTPTLNPELQRQYAERAERKRAKGQSP